MLRKEKTNGMAKCSSHNISEINYVIFFSDRGPWSSLLGNLY